MRRLYLAVGWAMIAAVVWLSLTPSPPQVDFNQSDKVGHLLAYGGLMFWFSQLYSRRAFLFLAFVAMGVGLELVQGELAYRSADIYDAAANTLGVLLGWAAALIRPRALPGARQEPRSAGR